MAQLQPFSPAFAKSQSIAVGTSSSAAVTIDPVAKNVRFCNIGTNAVSVRVSNNGAAASITSPSADLVIPPNSVEIITKGEGLNQVTAIALAAGNTLWVSTGEGW